MINFGDFCSEIFQILRAYGREIVLYDESGNRVYEPDEARRFYVIGENILISIREDSDNSSLKLYLSPSVNLGQATHFIEMLRNLAVKANLLFHVKKFNKEIKPQDFATKASVNEQENLNMNLMEGLYGTSKSSYLKLENARMIVRHSAKVNERMIGSRGRNIQAIFIENAIGERALFPVNLLSGGRAMAQHVNQGGNFADEVGQQIIRMAQDFRNLAKIANHGDTASIPQPEVYAAVKESISTQMRALKRSFARVYETKYYTVEAGRLTEAASLMEDSEAVSAKLEGWVAVMGESIDRDTLMSAARLIALPEAQVMTEDDETDLVEDDEADDVEAEDELEENQIDLTVEGTVEQDAIDCSNNPVIREFESWMEGFEPESMFEQSQKNPSDMTPEEVQAELDQIESKYAEPSDMPEDVAARWDALAKINVTNLKWGTARIKHPVDGEVDEAAGDFDVKAMQAKIEQQIDDGKYAFGQNTYAEGARHSYLVTVRINGKLKRYTVKAPTPEMAMRETLESCWARGDDYDKVKTLSVKLADVDEALRVGSKGYQQAARISSSNISRDADEKRRARKAKQEADKVAMVARAKKEGKDIDEAEEVEVAPLGRAKKAVDEAEQLDEFTFAQGAMIHNGPDHEPYLFAKGSKIGFISDTDATYFTDGVKIWKGPAVDRNTEAAMSASQNATEQVMNKMKEAGKFIEVSDSKERGMQAKLPEQQIREFGEPAGEENIGDLKAQLNAAKIKLRSMSPFDSQYRDTKNMVDSIENKLRNTEQYGKPVMEYSDDDAGDVSDLKAQLNAAKIKLASMSPFDSEYQSVKRMKDDAEQKLKGMSQYGKPVMEYSDDDAGDVSDLKAQLNDAKAKLSKMGPFDAAYADTKKQKDELEGKLKGMSQYGKPVMEDDLEEADVSNDQRGDLKQDIEAEGGEGDYASRLAQLAGLRR